MEGLLRQSVDYRSASVDNPDKMVTIRGSSRLASGLSRQLSLDSTLWEHDVSRAPLFTTEKSLLSSNDDGENDNDEDRDDDDENPLNSMNNQNNSQMNDIPDDIDDRIDVNAEDQEEDLYPIRCTEVGSDLQRDSIPKLSEVDVS